jgi:hypothetical protein
MQKVRELRQRAVECREMAATAKPSDVQAHYEEMARIWDKLAQERLAFFVTHPEHDTDANWRRMRARQARTPACGKLGQIGPAADSTACRC